MQLFFLFKFIWNNLSDLNQVSQNLGISVTLIVFLCKIVNFMFNWNKVKKLEEEIRKKTSLPLTIEEEKVMMESVNVGRRLALAYRMFCIITMIFFGLIPFIAKDPNENVTLPVPIYLPFNPMDYYYQVCSVIILSIPIEAWIHSNIDIIAITFLFFGTSQLEILKCKLEKVVELEMKESNEIIERELYVCAKQQNEIYRLVLNFSCLSSFITAWPS